MPFQCHENWCEVNVTDGYIGQKLKGVHGQVDVAWGWEDKSDILSGGQKGDNLSNGQ